MVIEEGAVLGTVAGCLAVGKAGIIIGEAGPIGRGSAGITRCANDGEALNPAASRNDRQAALIDHSNSSRLIRFMGGTFVKFRHGRIGGINILLDHHGTEPGSRRIKHVSVVPYHRDAMK